MNIYVEITKKEDGTGVAKVMHEEEMVMFYRFNKILENGHNYKLLDENDKMIVGFDNRIVTELKE